MESPSTSSRTRSPDRFESNAFIESNRQGKPRGGRRQNPKKHHRYHPTKDGKQSYTALRHLFLATDARPGTPYLGCGWEVETDDTDNLEGEEGHQESSAETSTLSNDTRSTTSASSSPSARTSATSGSATATTPSPGPVPKASRSQQDHDWGFQLPFIQYHACAVFRTGRREAAYMCRRCGRKVCKLCFRLVSRTPCPG